MPKFLKLNYYNYPDVTVLLNMSLVRSIEPHMYYDSSIDGSVLRFNNGFPYYEYNIGQAPLKSSFKDYIEVKQTPEQIMEMMNA